MSVARITGVETEVAVKIHPVVSFVYAQLAGPVRDATKI